MKEFTNVRIEIFNDEFAENPRTFCERLTTIYSNCKSYSPDGRGIEEFDDGYGSIDWKRLDKDYIYLKIYAYIHSGITISTSDDSYPFNDRWDSGLFGIIAIRKEDARNEFGILRATTVKKIKDMMEAEVKELDNWYTGQVFGYRILDNDNNVIEVVGSYYGETDCEQEAEHAAEYWDKHYDTKTAI